MPDYVSFLHCPCIFYPILSSCYINQRFWWSQSNLWRISAGSANASDKELQFYAFFQIINTHTHTYICIYIKNFNFTHFFFFFLIYIYIYIFLYIVARNVFYSESSSSGFYSASCSMGTGFGFRAGIDVDHFRSVQRLRMSGAIPILPPCRSSCHEQGKFTFSLWFR
jgi:hypothetical protein